MSDILPFSGIRPRPDVVDKVASPVFQGCRTHFFRISSIINVAFVVKEPDAHLDEAEVRDHVARKLAWYKKPRIGRARCRASRYGSVKTYP